MLTLIGSLIGFLGSFIPEILKHIQDRRDKAHELKILEQQLEQQRLGLHVKLEAINIAANIAETNALYKTFYSDNKFVDSLNGLVRPVIAMSFFLLYSSLKFSMFLSIPSLDDIPFAVIYETLWTDEDAAIFAGIISFYFGHRAMNKLRGVK